jgi:hypothetical protein
LIGVPGNLFDILTQGFSGYRNASAVDQIFIQQRTQQHRHAPRFTHVLGNILAAGL